MKIDFNNLNAFDVYQLAIQSGDKRIPEYEYLILQSLSWSSLYAQHIIKGRWPEFEQKIKQEINNKRVDRVYISTYLFMYPELQPIRSKHLPLKVGKYVIFDLPNSITDEQFCDLFVKLLEIEEIIVEDNKKVAQHICSYREYSDSVIFDLLNDKDHKLQYVSVKHIPLTLFLDFFCIIQHDKTDFE